MKKLVLAAFVAGCIVQGVPAAQASCVHSYPPEPHPSHCACDTFEALAMPCDVIVPGGDGYLAGDLF